jgi:hypothetical protein
MSNVLDCVDDLKAKIVSVPEFKQKVFYVYSENDLLDKLKGLSFPAVGIMYENTQSKDDGNKMGMSAVLQCAVAVMVAGKTVANLDSKNEAALLLDAVRRGIIKTVSPTGHKWSFVMETCAGEVNGAIVYIQRWSTPIILSN